MLYQNTWLHNMLTELMRPPLDRNSCISCWCQCDILDLQPSPISTHQTCWARHLLCLWWGVALPRSPSSTHSSSKYVAIFTKSLPTLLFREFTSNFNSCSITISIVRESFEILEYLSKYSLISFVTSCTHLLCITIFFFFFMWFNHITSQNQREAKLYNQHYEFTKQVWCGRCAICTLPLNNLDAYLRTINRSS